MRFAAASLFVAASLQLTTLAYAQGAPEGAPPPAGEDDPNVSDADKERAKVLFEEGRQLLADGNTAAACKKFKESQKARPGIGTLYNLADCSEKLGKSATAYMLFVEVAERTKAALQTDREQKARERIAKLEPRLMKIRLSVPTSGRVKAVLLDGEVINPDDYNKAIPADPGEHIVVAKTMRDDGEPFEESVDLSDEGKTVTVAIPVAPGAKMKRRVGMIVGGGITALLGVGALAGGIVLGTQGDSDAQPAAIGLGVLGIAALAIGLPIFGVGFKKKPVRGGGLTDVPIVVASPVPDVTIGPANASAVWHF